MMDLMAPRSPFSTLIMIALSVFVCETIVMIIISFLPAFSVFTEILFDSTLLIILLSPLLYVFLFRPLVRDRADSKRAEEALGRSEKRYRTILESIDEGYFEVDLKGNFTFVNDSMCKIRGSSRDELIGTNNREYMDQKTAKRVYRNFNELYRTGKSVKGIEWESIRKDSTKRYVESSASLMKDSNGNPVGFRGIVADITERKLAEEALRSSENKHRTLIKNAGEAIIVAQDGIIKFVNPKGEELYGRSQEELASRPLTDFIHEEDRDMVGKRHKRRLRGEEPPKIYPFRIINKAGDTKWVQLSAVPFSWDDKPAVLCYMTDITVRKQAEDALQESEQWIRNIFKSLKEAVFVITPDRIFLDMNEAALEMFGYTKEELVNLPSDITHLDHEHYLEFGKKMEEVLNTGGITNFQFKMRRKNGEIFPSEHTASLMVDNEGKPIGIVSVVRDLSEQKKIEEEKEKLQTQLQQTRKMEAIATLAGGIAHEFNNALTGVVGNIELLEMRLPDNKIVTGHTEAMKSSSHRMANLTSQLLAYARGGSYQAKTISLSDFVEETLPVIKPNIGPSIRIDTDLPRDIFKVNVDSTQMQMVLSAVVSNSSEAIEGDGRIRVITSNEEIDAEFAKSQPELNPGRYVCLTVEDDGEGMDEEALNKIFDPFYTTKFIGRGLGMAAVYGIIRNHNGSISVESEPGRGTVVRIYFPVFEDIEEELSEKPSEEVRVISGTGTILVIEDEETVMNVIRAVLERLGYRMMEAKTGKEAIEISKTFGGDIDLALLDIKLPDIWGDKVYSQIMEARPNLKVIVCSGYSIDSAQTILDAGAQGFIQKPFTVETLSKKLNKILEGK